MFRAARSSVLLALLLLAGTSASAVVRVSDLAQPVSLAGQWKFQLGDEPAWAAAELDDREWQATEIPAHSPNGHAGYSGMLWYRVSLQLDLSRPSVRENLGALAVMLGSVMSSYELYAGGERVGGVGRLPPSPEAHYDLHRVYSIPASAVSADGRLVLALRVWRNPAVIRQWETGPYFGDFLLGNVGDLRAELLRQALLPNVVLAALYLMLGLYHLLIARRNPVLKEFFWFGLFSIALAAYTFETSQSKFILEIPYPWHKKLELLLLYLAPILFSNTLLAVTRTPGNLLTRGFNVVFGLYFITALIGPGDTVMSAALRSYQYLAAVWALALAALMGWRAYQGSRSARAVVVLLLLLFAAVFNDVLLQTALIGSGNVLYIVFALLLFFMALLMAERYTDTLKKLETSVENRTAELVSANRELATAVETKGNFLANMSHEMRTPMNAILGLTHLGLKTELTEQQRDYFSKVEQSAEDLQDIIDSILDFSKLEDGELECISEPFSPISLIEGIRRTWAESANEAGLEFVVQLDPEIPETLSGDAKRLKQVLGIFISNAVKFTEQGQVGLKIRLLDSHLQSARLRFAVSDTGVGIADHQREHLFEAFTQADNSTTRKYGGTGVGLSIAKRLVQLMGGHIDVDSAPGEGSTFSFELELPLTDMATASEETDADLDLTPIRGARVLLVDDSELNLQVAGELLRQANLYVDTAEDGRAAVEKVNSAPYDCVLMDVQMPVMDGYTATERIRSKAHFNDLPVIAMTANAMQQDRARGAKAGMNAYIPKPIEPAYLYRTLLKWITPGERSFDEKRSAASDAVEASGAELPDSLPGINIREGLKRVAGNTALYLNLLRDLLADYADAAQRLQALLAAGDTDAARQLAHKLRGIANNLGAVEIGGAAEDIELMATSAGAVEPDALAQLDAAFAKTMESQASLAPLMTPKEETVELDDEQRRAALNDVLQAVAENNPEALDLLDTLLTGTSETTTGYDVLIAARTALDIYDFAGARAHLQSVADIEDTSD